MAIHSTELWPSQIADIPLNVTSDIGEKFTITKNKTIQQTIDFTSSKG